MPYVPQAHRGPLDDFVDQIMDEVVFPTCDVYRRESVIIKFSDMVSHFLDCTALGMGRSVLESKEDSDLTTDEKAALSVELDGDANYFVCSLLLRVTEKMGGGYTNGVQLAQEIIERAKLDWLSERIKALLTCVSLEFYRRYSAPYEDQKARENGDLPWDGSRSARTTDSQPVGRDHAAQERQKQLEKERDRIMGEGGID